MVVIPAVSSRGRQISVSARAARVPYGRRREKKNRKGRKSEEAETVSNALVL